MNRFISSEKTASPSGLLGKLVAKTMKWRHHSDDKDNAICRKNKGVGRFFGILFFRKAGLQPFPGDVAGGTGGFVRLHLILVQQQGGQVVHAELPSLDAPPEEGGGGIQRHEPLEVHGQPLADHDVLVAEFPQDKTFFQMHGAKIAISAGNPYLYPGMLTRTDIFFALLRAGLWERDLRLDAAPSPADWQALLQTARQQAVLGLVYRGIAHLPDDQLPPADQRLRLLSDIDRIERRNTQMGDVQEELLRRFREAGLHPMVQKGSEAGKYYARPLLRESGDIDLFFPSDEFDRAKALPPGVRTAPDGAGVFTFRDVTVELHSHYFDLHLPESKLPEVPSVYAELLMLSAHILKHAIGAGVGCKQLCDMALALEKTEGQYDKAQLEAYLKAAGMLRWQRVLCSLLVADLGLDPARCLPGFKACDPAALRRIVLSGGAFGLFDPAREKAVRSGKAVRKMQAASAFLKRLPFSLRTAPRETIATIGELVKGNLS